MYKKAVFLDRDGVINKSIVKNGKSYPPNNFKEFEILPKVEKGLNLLKNAGFLLIIVTNQPDVGDRKQKKEIVDSFHDYLLQKLSIDHIEVCYDRSSFCFKPKSGMLFKAADLFKIDLKQSFMIGDRWKDIEAGKDAGCKTYFIDHSYKENLITKPNEVVTSLYEAAQDIVKAQKKVSK